MLVHSEMQKNKKNPLSAPEIDASQQMLKVLKIFQMKNALIIGRHAKKMLMKHLKDFKIHLTKVMMNIFMMISWLVLFPRDIATWNKDHPNYEQPAWFSRKKAKN